MAYALSKIIVTPKLYDVWGKNPSTPQFKFPQGANLPDPVTSYVAQVQTPAISLIDALALLTDSNIPSFNITLEYSDPAITLIGSGENTAKATLVLYVDDPNNPGKTVNMEIRNPVRGTAGIFLADSGDNYPRVDTADANLLAFLEQFTTTDGAFVVSDSETIDDTTPIKNGRLSTKK